VRFATTDVRLSKFAVALPDTVRENLQRRIDDLWHRRAILGTAPPLAGLQNASFENTPRGMPAAWSLSATPEGTATMQVERGRGFQGGAAVRVRNQGTSATFYSEPFPAPHTGRLSLSVRLRVDDIEQQPAVRLAVEGLWNGAHYAPFAIVGRGAAVPIPDVWTAPEFILKIDDVPVSGLSDLRVRFDVIGPGTVWIDDVQLLHLQFTPQESGRLGSLLALIARQFQNRNWKECQRELDGYWPRFLVENVPLPSAAVAETDKAPSPDADKNQAARAGAIERVRDWWKR
jgi:hypothetical protein